MKLEAYSAAQKALAEFRSRGKNTGPNSGATAGVYNNDQAAVVSLSNSLSVPRLENHISDYQRGRGYLSSDVGVALRSKNQQNAQNLKPSDSLLYATVTSLGGYGGFARVVDSVGRATDAAATIAAAPAQAEATTEKIKKIFGYES